MEVAVAISSVIVSRTLLEQLGGFDLEQPACNDYDLWLRLARLSEISGVTETLLHKRRQHDPYYHSTMVFEDIGRAIAKLLAASTDPSLRALLRRERAKVAAGLAGSQAICGGRWAALRTLARSSQYSWGYPEWWLGGAKAAARAVTPAGVFRAARAVVGRDRS